MQIYGHMTCCRFRQLRFNHSYTREEVLRFWRSNVVRDNYFLNGYIAALETIVPTSYTEVVSTLEELGFIFSPKSFNINGVEHVYAYTTDFKVNPNA